MAAKKKTLKKPVKAKKKEVVITGEKAPKKKKPLKGRKIAVSGESPPKRVRKRIS